MSSTRPPADLQAWMDARKRHRLPRAGADGARAGDEPQEAGQDRQHHRQEPWKAPLPEFIQHLYRKRFGRDVPADLRPLEERAREAGAKKAARKAEKRARRDAE